ncbi:MAG: hypothetical protein V7K40_20545 [Nostoc sp.]
MRQELVGVETRLIASVQELGVETRLIASVQELGETRLIASVQELEVRSYFICIPMPHNATCFS